MRKIEKELGFREDILVEGEQQKKMFIKTGQSAAFMCQMRCSNLFVASMIKDKPAVTEDVIDSSFEEDDEAKKQEEEKPVLRL